MPTSSQGVSFPGVSNARKITIKKSRAGVATNSKLDASTLAIPHGGTRVYVDGLPDSGGTSTGDGITVTAAVEFLGSGPAAGGTVAWGGVNLKCIDSETTNEAGALVSGAANYTSDFPDEEEE